MASEVNIIENDSTEPSRQSNESDASKANGEECGLFAMTALPDGDDNTRPPPASTASIALSVDGNSSSVAAEQDEDFFDDIGYDQFVADCNAALLDGNNSNLKSNNLSELFSKLQSKANECKELQRSVYGLESNLKHARSETAAASHKDAIDQKQNDRLVEEIREYEENATKIAANTEQRKGLINGLVAENETIQKKIDDGPGWTDDQLKQKSTYIGAIEASRSKSVEVNTRLADLRSSLSELEKKVEASLKIRDEDNQNLDLLEIKIDDAREANLADEQKVNEAERNIKVMDESLQHAKDDLEDVKREGDDEKIAVGHSTQELERIQLALSNCSKELGDVVESDQKITSEFYKIRLENKAIEVQNSDKQTMIEVKNSELHTLLKERAKVSKMRELIQIKTIETEKERGLLEVEVDRLNISKGLVEVELPLVRKDTEILQRQIKSLNHELELLNRKAGVSKKCGALMVDLSRSNENELKSQENDYFGIKKEVDEKQRAKSRLDFEEIRDLERLRKMDVLFREKQRKLKTLEESNRLLEAKALDVEDKVKQEEDMCELERTGHNDQTKVFMGLRMRVNEAKHDYEIAKREFEVLTLEISRADEQVFREYRKHHSVDAERKAIENEARSFHDQCAKLEIKGNVNETVIVNLCRQIDEETKTRDGLRKQYRTIMSEKDIWCARLVATQLELEKVQHTMNRQMTALKHGEDEYNQLNDQLQAEFRRNDQLLNEKDETAVLHEKQVDQNEIVDALEQDLARQLDKNQKLAVELGRPINLHRWRHLQNSDKNRFSLIGKVHNLQKKVIHSTDKITSQSCHLEKKKMALKKLRREVSNQASVESIKNQLLVLKSEYHVMSKEIAVLKETKLQQRVDNAAKIKSDIVQLEKRKMELKVDYFVNIVRRS